MRDTLGTASCVPATSSILASHTASGPCDGECVYVGGCVCACVVCMTTPHGYVCRMKRPPVIRTKEQVREKIALLEVSYKNSETCSNM